MPTPNATPFDPVTPNFRDVTAERIGTVLGQLQTLRQDLRGQVAHAGDVAGTATRSIGGGPPAYPRKRTSADRHTGCV
jgi:hypothetical protein